VGDGVEAPLASGWFTQALALLLNTLVLARLERKRLPAFADDGVLQKSSNFNPSEFLISVLC
jgi:hypothetical protein